MHQQGFQKENSSDSWVSITASEFLECEIGGEGWMIKARTTTGVSY
jgi:hypothetical protein